MASREFLTISYMLVFTAIGGVESITSKTTVDLVDSGYTNVAVAIDEALDEDDSLIQAIMNMFVDGSEYLYRATRIHGVYYRNVTILIPSHWANKPWYRPPDRLTYDTADVRISEIASVWGPEPYTLQAEGCGRPGTFIHFWHRFLTDENVEKTFGNLGRVLAHEWGHLRWGLFNEYPDPIGDPDHFAYFYQSPSDNKWKPTSCSSAYNVKPVIRDTNGVSDVLQYRQCVGNEDDGYEAECVAAVSSAGEATGSIMFGQLALKEIADFCDDDPSVPGNLHNREADNEHNRLCAARSAWEVMRQHDDFNARNSSSVPLSREEIRPTFSFVQRDKPTASDGCRIVLVLDKSGSMSMANRLDVMIGAAAGFTRLLPGGTWVGIVTFNRMSVEEHELIQVNSDDDRQRLRDSLPLIPGGGTCIPCGLMAGLEVLKKHPSGSLSGAVILLMTDGDDRHILHHPVREELRTNGVRVDTVAIGQDAYGELNTIAAETGGLAHFIADNTGSAEILTALTQTVDRCLEGWGDSQKPIQVTRTTVTLISPDGDTMTVGNEGYKDDVERKTLTITIPGVAMDGKWNYVVNNTSPGEQNATLTVYSQPAVDSDNVITLGAEVSSYMVDFSDAIAPIRAYAQIRQGNRPVIGASVKALIARPGGYDRVELPLYDNGAGADVRVNDGIYSRFFTQFSGAGFYSIRIVAQNDGNGKVLQRASGSRAPPFVNISQDGQVESATSVGNVSLRLPGDTEAYKVGNDTAFIFERASSAGSTRVSSVPPDFTVGQDLFPPNRVQDLRVVRTSVETLSLVLLWTAPGDDLDFGIGRLTRLVEEGRGLTMP
ncbi:calcium-activated chloride channel regulator 1-like [Diadema setosum]|uniref:calcium-activated chloride channel regulator 1-like n=1 Tax=Diadema setosum TaxID=31175 RepID=UPI003B3B484A